MEFKEGYFLTWSEVFLKQSELGAFFSQIE